MADDGSRKVSDTLAGQNTRSCHARVSISFHDRGLSDKEFGNGASNLPLRKCLDGGHDDLLRLSNFSEEMP